MNDSKNVWLITSLTVVAGAALFGFSLIFIGATMQTHVPADRLPEIDALESEDSSDQVRCGAAYALGEMRPTPTDALPTLKKALKSRRWMGPPYTAGSLSCYDRAPDAARNALVRIGPSAIPILTDALQSEDPLTRVEGAWGLWQLTKQTNPVVSVLFKALRDGDVYYQASSVRNRASAALVEIAQVEKDTVLPELLKALECEDHEITCSVAFALADAAPQFAEAIPALIKVLIMKGSGDCVGNALSMVGAPAVSFLVELLHNEDEYAKERAAWVLSMMGREAMGAVPALAQTLDDRNPRTVIFAMSALEKIGPPARDAIPNLRESLKNENADIREAAIQALLKIEVMPLR